MGRFDYIVIGSGAAGLWAALSLAKSGASLLLLEQSDSLGGGGAWRRPGRFSFAPGYPLLNAADLSLLGLGREDCRPVTRLPRFLDRLRGVDLTLPTGREGFCRGLAQAYPGCASALKELFSLVEQTLRAQSLLEEEARRQQAQLSPWGEGAQLTPWQLLSQTAQSELKRNCGGFLRWAGYPAERAMEQLRLPEPVRDILSLAALAQGREGRSWDWVQFSRRLDDSTERELYWPLGGLAAVTAAAEAVLTQAGAEILRDCPAERLLLEKGRVRGVACKRGEIRAKQVIAACSPRMLYERLLGLENTPRRQRTLLQAGTGFSPQLRVDLGLNRSAEDLGLRDLRLVVGTKPEPTPDSLAAASSAAGEAGAALAATEEGRAAGRWFTAICPNIVEEEASPPRTCLLRLSQAKPVAFWAGTQAWDYPRLSSELGAELVSACEAALGLSLRPYIEELSISHPWGGGAAESGPTREWDGASRRWACRLEEQQPWPGLICCGGWAEEGGGQASARRSGLWAAATALGAHYSDKTGGVG